MRGQLILRRKTFKKKEREVKYVLFVLKKRTEGSRNKVSYQKISDAFSTAGWTHQERRIQEADYYKASVNRVQAAILWK